MCAYFTCNKVAPSIVVELAFKLISTSASRTISRRYATLVVGRSSYTEPKVTFLGITIAAPVLRKTLEARKRMEGTVTTGIAALKLSLALP